MKDYPVNIDSWNFYELTLSHQGFFEKYTENTSWPTNLWSASFPFLWAYGQSSKRRVLWRIVDQLLVVFCLSNEDRLFLPCLPFGLGGVDNLVKVLDKSMSFCHNWSKGKGVKVRALNQLQLDYLLSSSSFQQLFYPVQLRGLERHNSLTQLVQLSGKQFSSLRRTINKFHREYRAIQFRHYQHEDLQSVIDFNRSWERQAGKKYPFIVDRVYFREILKHHKPLGMQVMVAEQYGEIVGINIACILPTGQAWGCVCKTDASIAGLQEAIILKMVHWIRGLDATVELMNVGSDMGSKGLIAFKEKFRPVLSLPRYKILLKSR